MALRHMLAQAKVFGGDAQPRKGWITACAFTGCPLLRLLILIACLNNQINVGH